MKIKSTLPIRQDHQPGYQESDFELQTEKWLVRGRKPEM